MRAEAKPCVASPDDNNRRVRRPQPNLRAAGSFLRKSNAGGRSRRGFLHGRRMPTVKPIASWGHFLTDRAGKKRPANDADFSLKHLGYWTDPGAQYCYRFEETLGYIGTRRRAIARGQKMASPNVPAANDEVPKNYISVRFPEQSTHRCFPMEGYSPTWRPTCRQENYSLFRSSQRLP